MSRAIPFAYSHAPRAHLEHVDPGCVSHPYRPLHHAVTTLFEWTEVERAVRSVWTKPCIQPNHAAPRTLQETLSALEWIYLFRRAAIFVSIRDGKLRLFLPFANERFVSDAAWTVCDPTDHTREVSDEEYRMLKQKVTGIEEKVLPRQRWWCNGHLVCNVMPHNVWGDGHVAALHHMIFETCAQHKIPDRDFILNKRDAPLLTLDHIPSARAWVPGSCPMFDVLSFYTGPGALDRPFPLPDDWFLAGHGPYPCGLAQTMLPARRPQYRKLSKYAWGQRLPVAVFRGSSTGAGLDATTNQRIALVKLSKRHPDKIDARITKWNHRDRMLTTDRGKIIVTCPRVHDLEHTYGRGKRMSVTEQVKRYRYAIYVAGHQAASRLGELMLAGFTILYVKPRPEVLGQETWLDADLHRLSWNFDGLPSRRELQRCNVLPIQHDLSDLILAIDYLAKNPEVAYQLARNAQSAAAKRINTNAIVKSIRNQL